MLKNRGLNLHIHSLRSYMNPTGVTKRDAGIQSAYYVLFTALLKQPTDGFGQSPDTATGKTSDSAFLEKQNQKEGKKKKTCG